MEVFYVLYWSEILEKMVKKYKIGMLAGVKSLASTRGVLSKVLYVELSVF